MRDGILIRQMTTADAEGVYLTSGGARCEQPMPPVAPDPRRRLSVGLADDSFEPLGRGPAEVAQVDLVVFAPHLTAALPDKVVYPLYGGTFLGERTYVHDLGCPSLAEGLEPDPGERGSIFFGPLIVALPAGSPLRPETVSR